MKLKPGVRLRGIRPELVAALVVVEDVYLRVCIHTGYISEFVVTSIADSVHAEKASLHYAGAAFDFRIHDITDNLTKASLRAEVEAALGQDFDVVLEEPGTDNEHIHVEYQPKSV